LPLTDLTRKDRPWQWGKDEEEAFRKLQEALTTAPVLHIPDFTDPELHIEVHTDASKFALGGVLFMKVGKKMKPVAYHSRKFSSAERNYHTTE